MENDNKISDENDLCNIVEKINDTYGCKNEDK